VICVLASVFQERECAQSSMIAHTEESDGSQSASELDGEDEFVLVLPVGNKFNNADPSEEQVEHKDAEPYPEYIIVDEEPYPEYKIADRETLHMSFAGGGFRAHAIGAGVTAAFMAISEDLDSNHLYRNVGSFATSSGGSWFVALLAHSPDFVSLITNMASGLKVRPSDTAESLYKESFIDAFESTSKGAIGGLTAVGSGLISILGGQREDYPVLAMFEAFVQQGRFTWTDVIRTLLYSTGGIKKEKTMGGRVNQWADGKIWNVGHSIMVPLSGNLRKNPFQDVSFENLEYSMFMKPDFEQVEFPSMIPANFNIRMATDGGERRAPNPYCPSCHMLSVQYTDASTRDKILNAFKHRNSNFFESFMNAAGSGAIKMLGDVTGYNLFQTTSKSSILTDVFEEHASEVNLLNAVGASSAVAGGIYMSHGRTVASFLEGAYIDIQSLAVWTSSHLFEEDCKTKSSLILKERHTLGVVDSAYTENTGIAFSVGNGAETVVAVVSDAKQARFLFQESDLAFFKSTKGLPIAPQPRFQIFEIDELPMVATMTGNLNKGNFQMSIYRNRRAVTVDSKFFGIEKGKQVDLIVIEVKSRTGLGGTQKMEDFAKLAGETAKLLYANRANPTIKEIAKHLYGE